MGRARVSPIRVTRKLPSLTRKDDMELQTPSHEVLQDSTLYAPSLQVAIATMVCKSPIPKWREEIAGPAGRNWHYRRTDHGDRKRRMPNRVMVGRPRLWERER